MLELSCAEYTFPLLGRREALALIRLLDFDFVDIGLFARNPKYLPAQLIDSPRQFMDGVRNDLEAAGLRPADVFLQVGEHPGQVSANDPDLRVRKRARDTFAKAIELCSAISCGHLTGLPGVQHSDRSGDLSRAAEEAAWRVSEAAMAGVVYSIEPHVGSICGDVESSHALLAQAPGLTLTLDYGHFILQGESNETIHTLLPHASHLHLRGAASGRLQTAVAESTVDLHKIIRTLNNNSNGMFALEYVWSDWHECNRTDNLSETILLRRQIAEIEAQLERPDKSGATQHV